MKLTDLKSRYNIGFVLNEMGLTGQGVEVGVAFGENAEIILDTCKLETLYLIDPWDYVPNENPKGYADAIKDWEGCYNYCANLLDRFGNRAQLMKMRSVEAAECCFAEFDFVYIDANHMRPYIDNDLKAWYDKVKVGGIFGGHDYHMVNRPDYVCEVKAAVDEFFEGKGYTLHITEDADPSWYIIKK
tara:strand:+ start:1635 stop:2195 length:561 start_codon:yes stop_codon:yes gene_type:complete